MHTIPHEGGEELIWDINQRLIDPSLAEAAGKAAIDLLRNRDRLPFVHTTNHTNFNHIGIYDPEIELNPKGSIFAYDWALERAAPLLELVGELQLYRPEKRHAPFAALYGLRPGGGLPMHQDSKYDEYRSVTGLLGRAEVALREPRSVKTERFIMRPGDEYGVRHSQDLALATKHRIQVIGTRPRLVVFL